MKSFILIPCFVYILLLIHSCVSVGKKIVSQKERLNEIKIVDDQKIKNGLWVETLDSALQIANYKDGLKQGQVKIIYSNGEYSIENYKDNIRQGWTKFYNANSFLYNEILYENGVVVKRKSYSPAF